MNEIIFRMTQNNTPVKFLGYIWKVRGEVERRVGHWIIMSITSEG